MKSDFDTFGDSLSELENPWEQPTELAEGFFAAGEALSAASDGINVPGGLIARERDKLTDIGAEKMVLDPQDHDGLAKLEREEKQPLETIRKAQQQNALNNKRGHVLKGFRPKLEKFRREYPRAIPILAPIEPQKKPDKAIIIDARKEGESFLKQIRTFENASLPIGNSLASMEREIDGDAWLPDFSKWTSRTRDPDDWNSASLTPENLYGIICELLGDELKAKYREKFERHHKARGAGLTNQEIKEKVREINEKWLAVQRLEHSHMKGFERDGLTLTYNSRLSIFVALEFRVEGITALHGKHGHFEESW